VASHLPLPRTLSLLLAGLALASTLSAQGNKVQFAAQVWPILERRCVECHAAPKVGTDGKTKRPKGGVVLDGKEALLASKGGKLAVAKDPEHSLLLEVVAKPADDEDRMPPPKHGEPLTAGQVDTIRAWITQGADFGSWTGVKAAEPAALPGKPNPTGPRAPTREEVYQALAKGLAPLPAATLQSFDKGPFRVQSLGNASPLLAVHCCGSADLVDDQALAELQPLAQHLAELDLARTQVTDAGCATLANLPRLVALDLRQSQVGNRGAAQLAACRELRTLNLFGTKVADYGAAALGSLPNLERLYLWQTDVTAAAVVRLREARPNLRVVFAAELPEAPAEGAGNRRQKAK
jgi:hypothetical protein